MRTSLPGNVLTGAGVGVINCDDWYGEEAEGVEPVIPVL